MAEAVVSTHADHGDLGSEVLEGAGAYRIPAPVVTYLDHIEVAHLAAGRQGVEDVGLGIAGQYRREASRPYEQDYARLIGGAVSRLGQR